MVVGVDQIINPRFTSIGVKKKTLLNRKINSSSIRAFTELKKLRKSEEFIEETEKKYKVLTAENE